MMSNVRSPKFRAVWIPFSAAWLLAAACFTGLPSQAGEAGASFQVTVQVIPEAAGACSASTELGAPQLTCRPTVVGSVASGADPRQQPGAVYLRSDAPAMRVAGEMVEVGGENYKAWLENNPTAWSERSERRVVAGGREYVEMTFSW
jgi:hypothetical protein